MIQNNYGEKFKCWGWSESQHKVTFIYSDQPENENVPEKLTTVACPIFSKEVNEIETYDVNGISYKKKITRILYTMNIEYNEDNMRLISYSPVYVKVHLKRLNVFNVVGLRLVRRVCDNRIVYLVIGKDFLNNY